MSTNIREMVWKADLGPTNKIVLLFISSLSDDAGNSEPVSISAASECCGICERSVQSATKHLKDVGIISGGGGGGRGRSSSYKIDLNRLAELVRKDEDGQSKTRTPIAATVRIAVYGKTMGVCAYCSCTMRLEPGHPDSFTVDHDLPVSRGGSNDLGNLIPACWSCNAAKRSMTAREFLAKRGGV